MARQGRSNTSAAPAEDKTEGTTAPAEGTEAPVTTTESTEETPVNLDAFKAAVEASLGEADTTTGQVPESAVTSVNEEYRKLEGQKGKNAARKFLEDAMLAAVGELDAVKARSYSELKAGLSTGGGSSTPKAPADPGAAYVQRMAALDLARGIVYGTKPEIEGRDLDAEVSKMVTDLGQQVADLQAWTANEAEDKGDAPEVSPVVRQAVKLSTGKASGSRSGGGNSGGPRRDTGKHIASAFADKAVGDFLTIAEIAKHKSAEYGDDSPSQGAISARLFPTTTVEGVEPVEKGAIDGKNPKGARKIA
jgi:hypothetical protein